jgi:amino acid adenylation domain-containing protein
MRGWQFSKSEVQEIEICLDAGLTLRIHSFARDSRVTTGTVIQAAWGVVLARFAGVEDVTFGSVATMKPSSLPEPTIGLFTTIIPSRIRIIPDKPLAEWLQEFQTDEVTRRQWGFVPLRQLREWSGLPKDQPLFDSVFVYQNYPRLGPSILNSDRLTVSRVQTFEQTHYPLVLTAIPTTGLTLKLSYLSNRYNARLISKLLVYLQMTLSLMADGEATLVRDLFALIPADQEMIETANDTRTEWDSTRCLHQLFEEQVQIRLDSIAAIDPKQRLSYRELNKRANQVARLLRSFGAHTDVPVGVCLERSVHTLVALLAIYKAGGVYVPLDPSSPALYLSSIIEDAGVRIILTDSASTGLVSTQDGVVLCLESDPRIAQQEAGNLETVISSRNLAYIMYTSGSTGTAKGVAVEQKQFLNRLWWMWNCFPFRPHELCCQRTSLNFSVSMWELLGPVLCGTAILIAPDSITRDANSFIHFLSQHAPTRIVVVPSLLRVLLETELNLSDKLRALRLWSSCGESMVPDLLRKLRKRIPHARLLNQYGASELNDVSYYDTSTWDESEWQVPVGRPIHNVRILLLDKEMSLCPVSVPGEIHIASINPARGYLNRPALTAERFIPDPYSDVPGSRLYKTGDVGRWSEEGILEHLGRTDNEIKIRGARVNIHGVEAILHSHPAIQEAMVTVQESKARDKYLVAHLVLKQSGTHQPADFRNFLTSQVPAHMVPTAWNLVEKFQYLPNGKVDRKAMSAAFAEKPVAKPEHALPATAVEKLVCEIWAAILGIQVVSREDNFFDLGGNSLQATRAMSRLGARSSVELPVQLLFEHPRVMELATAIEKIVVKAEDALRKHLMEEIQQLSDEEVAQELYKLRAGSTSI